MARWSRKDSNHDAIVESYKKCGYLVVSLTAVGNGCPDALVFHPSVGLKLVEIKTDTGKLRPKQVAFQAQGWPVEVVRKPIV